MTTWWWFALCLLVVHGTSFSVTRNVWLITATYDIELVVNHIPGKDNGLADSLSRWYGGTLSRDTITQLLEHQWCPVTPPMLELDFNI